MKVLVACEESQTVTEAFRDLGHEAYSCDILDCSGGHPEWHIKGSVMNHLNEDWDLMIAHPPCKFLTVTANRSFLGNPERWKHRLEAVKFAWRLMHAPIKKIAIENPVGVLSTHIRKPEQYIQPYEYGHNDSKKTGLWLQNLPLLVPTDIVEPEWVYPKSGSGKRMSKTHANSPSTVNKNNAKLRSKTYSGIATAMASQWGGNVNKKGDMK